MSLWKKAKDRAVMGRLEDEAFYAQAADEMSRGVRRDGLWAKAIALSNGSESTARTKYISLLVAALRDEAYIAKRVEEIASTSSQATTSPISPQTPYISQESSAAIQTMSLLKRSWFMLLVLAAFVMIVVALPIQIYTSGVNFMQLPVVLIWLGIGHYAYAKLFTSRSSVQTANRAESPKRRWGTWDTIGLFFFVAWLIWLFARSQ
jgi:hypothetical protein